MTKQTEALKMAIEAMELHGNQYPHMVKGYILDAIQACKEALAQPTSEQSSLVQEPVAWMNDIAFSMDKELLGTRSRIVPLYTTPPSREWVGLSDEDVNRESAPIALQMKLAFHAGMYVAQKILKEKNN
jgi:hypothetical protein